MPTKIIFKNPPQACTDCVSGPRTCTCSSKGQCVDTGSNVVGQDRNVTREVLCQQDCIDTAGEMERGEEEEEKTV